MDVVETVADLDQAPELHAARLLLLLDGLSEEDEGYAVQGLTKLAKLDFLLRYPVMLQKALEAKGKSTRDVKLENHERNNVESEMVRYRFGPWDHRYRSFLNILVAKSLVTVNIEGRTVVISLTESGRGCASELAKQDVFEPYARRSRVLKRHFDITATHLMQFIYETIPEVGSLRSGESIPT